MYKNTNGQKITVFAFDSTTNLPKTGDAANITAYYDLDDAGVTVLTDTSATEKDSTNAKGYYIFDLAQAETNANKILFSAKSSTSNIVLIATPAVVYTYPANFTTTSIDGSGRVDLGKILGTASAGAAGYAAVDLAQVVPTSPTAGTLGESLLMMLNRVGRRNTAQAGGASTITLDAGASAVDNIYATHGIKIISGTGSGQFATIDSYIGSTKVATISRAGGNTWTTNPDNTSVFQIEANAKMNVGFFLYTLLTETTGQIAAAFKQFFNIASPTSTMNTITAVTTTATATNLTNAPTNGDFTAAMKTSLDAATPASVVGAVGSVTANVNADIKKVNGVTVNGDGSGTPWGP